MSEDAKLATALYLATAAAAVLAYSGANALWGPGAGKLAVAIIVMAVVLRWDR